MLHPKKTLAAGAATLFLGLGVASCGGTAEDTTSTSASIAAPAASANADAPSGEPGGGVAVSSVTSADELVSLIQEAYGEPSLGLHRGHQDVESTLVEVLGISHDELHVRMDAGQNLAAIADDVGVDRQELIDALVATRTPAIARSSTAARSRRPRRTPTPSSSWRRTPSPSPGTVSPPPRRPRPSSPRAA